MGNAEQNLYMNNMTTICYFPGSAKIALDVNT